MVDGNQSQQQTFTATDEFRPCVLATPLKLESGQHDLTLSFSPDCSDIDLVELVPQAPGNRK
jgi:hypothetical protein